MARVASLTGLRIEQHDSPNKGGTMADHRGIVLHIAQGSYRGTINWQLNPDQRYKDGTRVTTSSTWVVGREWGEWAQMVDSDRIAWCQRDGSRTWLSIELAGYAPQPPSAWQVEACAQLLAWAHKTHGIPLAVANHPGERGLGHHSMDREWLGEEWGHDECPGAGVIAAKGQIVAKAKQIIEEDDMTPEQDARQRNIDAHTWSTSQMIEVYEVPCPGNNPSAKPVKVTNQLVKAVKDLAVRVAALEAKLADPVDEAKLAEQLRNLLQPIAPGVTIDQIRELLRGMTLRPEV